MPRERRREDEHHIHVPHSFVPMPLKALREKHGLKFISGSHGAIDSLHVKPKQKIMLIGDHNYGDFVQALTHSASRKTPNVYSHILPRGAVVSDDSDELSEILEMIRRHRPDIIMFAFRMHNWPAKNELYKTSKKVNQKRFFASMPGITFDAVKEILPFETAIMEEKTLGLSRLLESNRGGELLIKTVGGNRDYYLKTLIPREKKSIIHCDVPRPGTVFNLPGGEAFFSPRDMHGEIYFSSGSVVGNIGVVKEGMRAKFVNNELRGIEWSSFHDKRLINRIMQKLDMMETFECSELGIGTHPSITMKNAGLNPLLIHKVVNTLHLGFGKPRATALGNVLEKDFLDIAVPRSFVELGPHKLIQSLASTS